jgi:dipeptidyl aminopeptidase/acylaminoacyl peptidase
MRKFFNKKYVVLLFLAFVFVLPGYGQEAELRAELKKLNDKISDLSYTFDQLSKKIEDNSWYSKIGDIAYIDKIRLTGPAHPSKNKTAKGVNNPLVFWSYIFMPKNLDPSKKYPLIVLVHGGLHGNFGIGNDHIVREFVTQGYIVAAPEYRGSSGYGKGFHQKIDYGGLEIDDTKACRDYMVENFNFIDSKRIGVVGWSHGGFHVLHNIFNYPESYAVAYAGVPVSNLIMRLGYMDNDYRRLFSADYHIGKDVSQDVKEYRRRSPVFQAYKLKKPLLIHANTNDDNVLIEEVEHLIAALKASNKKIEYEVYDNAAGGHMFVQIDSHLAKGARFKVYKYLQTYLKPEKPFKTINELTNASYLPFVK